MVLARKCCINFPFYLTNDDLLKLHWNFECRFVLQIFGGRNVNASIGTWQAGKANFNTGLWTVTYSARDRILTFMKELYSQTKELCSQTRPGGINEGLLP
jgi:hypothetical protein